MTVLNAITNKFDCGIIVFISPFVQSHFPFLTKDFLF